MAVAEDASPELKILQLRCILEAKERECTLLRQQLADDVRYTSVLLERKKSAKDRGSVERRRADVGG
jgi:hypothetical protein